MEKHCELIVELLVRGQSAGRCTPYPPTMGPLLSEPT